MTHPDNVVLLHGIGKNSLDLWPASMYLHAQGYKTHNITYGGRSLTIDGLADLVWTKIAAIGIDRADVPMHFVAHSLGGLVADHLIRRHKPHNLGRVVMWGTPLQGCDYADRLNESGFLGPIFRLLYGQAGQDLQIACEEPGRNEAMTYAAGMIAGTKSVNPLASMHLQDTGEHDGIVPLKRTFRPGLKDHLTLPISHTGMLLSGAVREQTLHFLQEGRFLRTA